MAFSSILFVRSALDQSDICPPPPFEYRFRARQSHSKNSIRTGGGKIVTDRLSGKIFSPTNATRSDTWWQSRRRASVGAARVAYTTESVTTANRSFHCAQLDSTPPPPRVYAPASSFHPARALARLIKRSLAPATPCRCACSGTAFRSQVSWHTR